MDLNDGRFLQNGGCGYVLKPAVMRDEMAYFSANTRDLIPGVSPLILHIKVRYHCRSGILCITYQQSDTPHNSHQGKILMQQ